MTQIIPNEASEERQKEARDLYIRATGADGNPADRSRWGTLWTLQKKWKKGWKILGFTDREIERIKVNKPDWV